MEFGLGSRDNRPIHLGQGQQHGPRGDGFQGRGPPAPNVFLSFESGVPDASYGDIYLCPLQNPPEHPKVLGPEVFN